MRYSVLTLVLGFLTLAAAAQRSSRGISYTMPPAPILRYTLSMPRASEHYFHADLSYERWFADTLSLKMPNWTPGYYQLLNFSNNVENVVAKDGKGRSIPITKLNDNTWRVTGIMNKPFTVSYDVKATKTFVAESFVDQTHGYAVPAGIFMYPDGWLSSDLWVTLKPQKKWKFVTGLRVNNDKGDEFYVTDFDELYDCPILLGDLETLPSFKVRGVEHRFIGYQLGTFDRVSFMKKLEKVVEASVNIIGDVPFPQYTFIAIGKGGGGIEHLNNTTFAFDGNALDDPAKSNRMLNFLAHEYFHHYNVKRIRPFELGPFDYNKGSKTNLLWVSEGLSVYYEFVIVRRAALSSDQLFLENFENVIGATENNPGRLHQSLTQASFKTWSDGPMGTQGEDPSKAISYYDKGPAVGLLLDLAIRQSSHNKKSLDDVMRHLYNQYYKKLQRGFTDAEFQQSCETIAGAPLTEVFEYVYTTKEPDYNKYLAYAGLKMEVAEEGGKKVFSIKLLDDTSDLQKGIWEGITTGKVK